MLNKIFKGLFDTNLTTIISVTDFLLCIVTSLAIGLIISLAYMYRTRYTKSFIITLAILPAVVCVVIMMVNGNVGAGVAVAGAFSLVRFRSVPGTAKEIGTIFLAMCSGIISGMGYITFALLFTVIMCVVFLFYNCIDFGITKQSNTYKTITITIPENLNYTDVFDEIFEQYTSSHSLIRVKTTNMGSLFRLTYDIILRDINNEKEFIDKLRTRNGNLEITISRQETIVTEL